jgi:predicted phage terminase large subunit-like protein
MKISASESQALAALCRSSLEDFVREFWSEIVAEKLIWNWHMTYLCQRLQRQAERVFQGLPRLCDEVINIPPGTSKSLLCSVFFPIWVWTRMPSARTVGASYAEKLSLDLSRKSRDLVKCDLFQSCFPEIQIKDDVDAKYYFANTKGGIRYAVGSKGSVTGFHFHFIVIDDPIDPNKVISEAELASTNHWLKQTLSSRKVDKRITVTFLIMQRLHENDPTAMFLKMSKVFHTRIPASDEFTIAPKQLSKFYKNGLLDPIRMPISVLDESREQLGEYGYAGQFGQDPIPAGGGMFLTDMLRIEIPPPLIRFRRIVRFWDVAGTRLKGSNLINRTYARTLGGNSVTGGPAYTAGVKLGIANDGRLFILNVKRFRLETSSRDRIIRETALTDGPHTRIGIEQEGGSDGSHEYLLRQLPMGYPAIIVKPKGDKAVRAQPFANEVNKGNVFLAPGDWHGDFINEMKFFPYGSFLDQIDASSGALEMLSLRKRRKGAIRSRYHMTT